MDLSNVSLVCISMPSNELVFSWIFTWASIVIE